MGFLCVTQSQSIDRTAVARMVAWTKGGNLSVLVMFFLNVTCKSLWSRNALFELKYAYINRSKNL